MTKPEAEFAAVKANCLAIMGYAGALGGQIAAFFPQPKPKTGHPADAPGAIEGLLDSCRAGAENILALCDAVADDLEGLEPLPTDDPAPAAAPQPKPVAAPKPKPKAAAASRVRSR